MKYRKPPRHQTGKPKTRNVSRPRLPKDYPWAVICTVKSDLDNLLNAEVSSELDDIIKHRDVARLLEFADSWGLQSISLKDWEAVADIAAVYQLSSLLKRYPFETEKSTRLENALKKFYEAEQRCKEFNHSLWQDLASPSVESNVCIFTYARSFIHSVLGDYPEWNKVVKWSRHGPGATLSTQNGDISYYHKYARWPYDVTKAAYGHAVALIKSDERWHGALEDSYRDVMEIPKYQIIDQQVFWANVLHVVDGNRVTFVPKDARTERTIAVEPTINLMLQLGVDGYIRRRLKRFQVNLDDQTKNQELARRGSIDGSFSTIDLKAASDSVSNRLCELLLPPLWYDYLQDLRSPQGTLRNETIYYEKISSMGNGFTFALESLIFASIIYAVVRHKTPERKRRYEFAVFGDDLIVETAYTEDVIEQLGRFGFATNLDKTFLQGPIRESCGTDWFRGHLIRPVFLTECPADVKGLFSARNRLQRSLELRFGMLESLTVSTFDKWIPENCKQFFGPLSDEDFDSYRHVRSPEGLRYKHGMWAFKRLTYVPVSHPGRKFLFRKLMVALRPAGQSLDVVSYRSFDRALSALKGLKGGGSCFTVTRRNRVAMSVNTSRTSIWCDEYRS